MILLLTGADVWSGFGYSVVVSAQYFQADVSIVNATTIPIQAWTGPEGSRRLRFPDFMTNGT